MMVVVLVVVVMLVYGNDAEYMVMILDCLLSHELAMASQCDVLPITICLSACGPVMEIICAQQELLYIVGLFTTRALRYPRPELQFRVWSSGRDRKKKKRHSPKYPPHLYTI